MSESSKTQANDFVPHKTATSIWVSRKRRKIIKDIVTYILLAILTLYSLGPFLWILSCSLRPGNELFTKNLQLLPKTWTLSLYRSVLQQTTFWRPLINTILVGTATAFVATLIAAFSAYSLARYRYRGRRVFTVALLVTQMLPGVLILLPIFLIFNKLGIYNTRLGLVIGFTTFAVPYSVLVMRSYFHDIPPDLEEASMVDGTTRIGAFLRITLPLSSPVLVATFLNVFILVWNDIIFTLMLTKDTATRTISVALHLSANSSIHGNPELYGKILAEGVLISLPIVILFTFLQRYVVEGMTAGALKA